MTILALVQAFKATGLGDLFQSGSALANLGVLGVLGVAVLGLAYLHVKSDQREERRADDAVSLANKLSDQFDRALDILERQINGRRVR